jgi:hypothetical protein
MANINQPTLILFETLRRKMEYIPPANSNEVFKVASGTIVLQTLRDSPNDYRFDLRIQNNIVNTGSGTFFISGDIINVIKPYRSIYINSPAHLIVNDKLEISQSKNNVDGTLEFGNNAIISMIDSSEIMISNSAILNIGDNVRINVDDNSFIRIFGTVNIAYSSVNSVLGSRNVIIDNSAIINITGLPVNRPYSMTDYVTDLRKRYQSPNTIGSRYVSTTSRVTYYWKAGDPLQPSDVLSLVIETGDAALGDFNLSFVGMPKRVEPSMQILTDLTINKLATLHVSEMFRGASYVNPTLFISQIVGNTSKVGSCDVFGKIIVDGQLSCIKVDRGGYITIEESGEIILINNASISNSNNPDSKSLFIYGKLIIDDISQLRGFSPWNIEFGPKGKIIILNTNKTETKRILFSTPNGIQTSELYRLFGSRLDKVIYHIQANDGIKIDQFFYEYNNMSDWYGGMRLEKAVKTGYIIWHDGGFIELDQSIIPWVDDSSTLLKVGNLFNVFGDTDKEKLQNAVNRLVYAGFESIVFKFITKNNSFDIILTLDNCHMVSAFYNAANKRYQLMANNQGTVFVRNKVTSADIDNLINPSSKVVNIDNPGRTEFSLL